MAKLRVKVLDDLTVEEYLNMRDEGLRHIDIAKKCFVSPNTFNVWVKKQKDLGKLSKITESIRSRKANTKMHAEIYADLRAKGKSIEYIASEIGVGRSTLTKWIQREKNAGRLPELSYTSEWREWLNKSS